MICPVSTDICRIRYDFTTMVLATQVVGAASTTTVVDSSAIGACITDSFSISSLSSGQGSPIICGTNTGYHMVIDQAMGSTECQKVNFNIGGSTTTSRSWTIKVTQYACGDEDKGGPPGCLQYFTGTVGNVASYGFPASITATTGALTHLQNQNYENCFRREDDYCYICYTVKIAGASTSDTTMNSFGVSISAASTATQSQVGTGCTTDYIDIPNVITETQAKATTIIAGPTRLCGRFLALSAAQTAAATVCSRATPFRLGVTFDDSEEATGTISEGTSDQQGRPGGITGFSLYFFQGAC